jgi:Flagellar hook-length control protein FliK
MIERLKRWQGTCKESNVVSLSTFAGLLPAAAETQSVFSTLNQVLYPQGVSKGSATDQNETTSSAIGNALSWDSQRQMYAELSSMEPIHLESLPQPPSSPGVLTSTDAYRFASAQSGSASIPSNTADSRAMPASNAPINDATTQKVAPGLPGVALSILDMQGGTSRQAPDLSPAQSSEPKATSVDEPIVPSSVTSSCSMLAWAPLLNSAPPALDETEAPIDVQAVASPPVVGPQPTPGGKASIAKPALSSQTSRPASVPAALASVPPSTTYPVAPKAKRDSSSLAASLLPVGGGASMFQASAIKTANAPAFNATSAEPPSLSGSPEPAIASTVVGGGIGPLTGDAISQSAVDHLSFELTLHAQSPSINPDVPAAGPHITAVPNAPAPNDGVNDGAGASGTTLAPSVVSSRPPTFGRESDPSTSIEVTSADQTQPIAKRNIDPPNSGSTNVLLQSPSSSEAVVSPAQILAPAFAPHATPKQEASPESVSTGPPIVLPETKAPTPQGVVHDVQLRLQGEAGENVSVRLSDRSGQVQISVRSSDQATATALRQDLPTLSANLEKQGWKTDLPESPSQTAIHDPSSPEQSDQQGRQRNVPEWQDAPDRKRQSPSDLWADLNEQETK